MVGFWTDCLPGRLSKVGSKKIVAYLIYSTRSLAVYQSVADYLGRRVISVIFGSVQCLLPRDPDLGMHAYEDLDGRYKHYIHTYTVISLDWGRSGAPVGASRQLELERHFSDLERTRAP